MATICSDLNNRSACAVQGGMHSRSAASRAHAPAGGYFDKNNKQTPLSQLHTYKAVYAAVQRNIEQGGMLKGILFWRWAGGDPTIDMSSENEATTLGGTTSQ